MLVRAVVRVIGLAIVVAGVVIVVRAFMVTPGVDDSVNECDGRTMRQGDVCRIYRDGSLVENRPYQVPGPRDPVAVPAVILGGVVVVVGAVFMLFSVPTKDTR